MNLTSLFNLTYGLCLISSKNGDKINACVVNSVFQVTSENPTIAISMSKKNFTYEMIKKSGIFNISILGKQTPTSLIGNFGFKSGKDINKFENYNYEKGKNGAPILKDYTISYIEAEVINSIEVGTHTVFIGKIVDCEYLSEAEPMTYAYYHNIKGGRSAKNAPTFAQQEAEEISRKTEKSSNNKKYKCDVCGYIYDPQIGDPENGIDSETSFEKIPEEWVCPICRVHKNRFTIL